jgi:hypothetical protein
VAICVRGLKFGVGIRKFRIHAAAVRLQRRSRLDLSKMNVDPGGFHTWDLRKRYQVLHLQMADAIGLALDRTNIIKPRPRNRSFAAISVALSRQGTSQRLAKGAGAATRLAATAAFNLPQDHRIIRPSLTAAPGHIDFETSIHVDSQQNDIAPDAE